MKRPFFLRTRNPGRRNAILSGNTWLTTGAFLLIALIVRLAAPGVLTLAATPVWSAGTLLTAATGDALLPFANTKKLVAERDQLQLDNDALTAQNATLEAQVKDLQTLVGSRSVSTSGILAGVLARPPLAPYDTLVIDRGSAEGIMSKALARGPGGVPLGTVAEVSVHAARIALFSSAGTITQGWAGDNRIPIMLTGAGAGALEASLPRDAGAVVGMKVYVPGPGALAIGTIVRIDSDPASPTVALHIQPILNPFEVTWVEVAPAP